MTAMLPATALGIVAGLRAMTAAAAASWAARLGVTGVEGTWLAFLGYAWTSWIMTALALAELVTDQLPSTPSRKVPVQFGTRIVIGAVAGAAIGMSGGSPWLGGAVGAVGAVLGTYGGAAVRGRLAARFGQDRPAALIEDAVAIVAALAVVQVLR